MKLLEDRHREQVHLYKLHLAHSEERRAQLGMSVQRQQSQRDNITRKLHRFMETQWHEALMIINEGVANSGHGHDPKVATSDRLDILMSKSHSHLEEVLSMNVIEEDQLPPIHSIPPLDLDTVERSSLGVNTSNKQQAELELQKYIQMVRSFKK